MSGPGSSGVTGYFVTGTDTNVGKTYVTTTLARRATSQGHKVFAFKPMETGGARAPDGSYIGADQELLCAAAGGWQTGALRGVYCFALPASPLVAAEYAGSSIDLARVDQVTREGEAQATLSLIEGAGGWRVPITAEADMSTFAKQIGLPVIIVGRAGLGTINHSLLSIEAVERDGLTIASLILSERDTDDPDATLSNRDEIRRRWPGSVIILGTDNSVLDRLLPIIKR